MNKAEAIKILNNYDLNFCDIDGNPIPPQDLAEACDMAIEALEQEPTAEYSSDVISRQAAIEAICEDGTMFERQGQYSITMAERKQRDTDILDALPSAQPFTEEQIQTMQELEAAQVEKAYELGKADRPTGHWIENDNGTFSCSNCQSRIPKEQHHYARHCLYCGARMESEE